MAVIRSAGFRRYPAKYSRAELKGLDTAIGSGSGFRARSGLVAGNRASIRSFHQAYDIAEHNAHRVEEVHENYGAVYRVIREANLTGYITPGLRGRMYQAIDNLKSLRTPADQISIAERISVKLHALDWCRNWAIRKRGVDVTSALRAPVPAPTMASTRRLALRHDLADCHSLPV